MKKQITYPKFIPRLFATTLDLFFLSIPITPLMNIISHKVFLQSFNQFFVDYNIDVTNEQAIATAIKLPEFSHYLKASSMISYLAILFLIHFVIMGFYFVGFWNFLGASPGKIIMRMKVVDADDISKQPSTYKLIKRFISYLTAVFGIWGILISKRGQALHDNIAGTVVIKS